MVHSHVAALNEEIEKCQLALCNATNVETYDRLKLRIKFLRDTLLRYNPVKEMPVKVVVHEQKPRTIRRL